MFIATKVATIQTSGYTPRIAYACRSENLAHLALAGDSTALVAGDAGKNCAITSGSPLEGLEAAQKAIQATMGAAEERQNGHRASTKRTEAFDGCRTTLFPELTPPAHFPPVAQ